MRRPAGLQPAPSDLIFRFCLGSIAMDDVSNRSLPPSDSEPGLASDATTAGKVPLDATSARSTEPDRKPTDEPAAAKASVPSEADAPDRGTSRKKKITIAVVIILAVLGIAAGIAYYLYTSQFVTTDDAFVDGEIVRVAPQLSGVLVAVPIADNTRVKAGDVLAKIDPKGPMATLALRQAQLDQAEASVAQAKAQISQAQAQVDQAQSTYDGDLQNARNARTQADRYQKLFDTSGSNAISRQTLDDARTQADQAEATANGAKVAIANAEAGVTAAQAQLTAAMANVEAQQAMLDTAQVDVDHLTVTASIDGQVVQKNVNLGSYVQPGTQMMALVPEHLYVTANYKETQLGDIRVGAKVDLTVDAYPDVAFEGTVQSIQNGAGQAFQLLPPQNATGNYVKVVQRVPVRISIDSPSPDQYALGPGMSVVPSIHVED